jgi:hypothetical protein
LATTFITAHSAAKEPGGVHAITAADEPRTKDPGKAEETISRGSRLSAMSLGGKITRKGTLQ